jgi:hypothetical protein
MSGDLSKKFRSCLFKQEIHDTFACFELLQSRLTLNQVITEVIDIWINFYMYDLFYLSIIFLEIINNHKNREYVIHLIKYILNILLCSKYSKNIVRLSKTNQLEYNNITNLVDYQIQDDKYIDLTENIVINKVAYKAMYVAFINKSGEFIYKSLNTILSNANVGDTPAFENLWRFLVQSDVYYQDIVSLGQKLCDSKIIKTSNKTVILMYTYLLIAHEELNEDNVMNYKEFEDTIEFIKMSRDNYLYRSRHNKHNHKGHNKHHNDNRDNKHRKKPNLIRYDINDNNDDNDDNHNNPIKEVSKTLNVNVKMNNQTLDDNNSLHPKMKDFISVAKKQQSTIMDSEKSNGITIKTNYVSSMPSPPELSKAEERKKNITFIASQNEGAIVADAEDDFTERMNYLFCMPNTQMDKQKKRTEFVQKEHDKPNQTDVKKILAKNIVNDKIKKKIKT